jgi:hypothetical protein
MCNLILRPKACLIVLCLAPYNFFLIRKTRRKSGSSEAKITDLHDFIYTKTDTLTSRKIFHFIASN